MPLDRRLFKRRPVLGEILVLSPSLAKGKGNFFGRVVASGLHYSLFEEGKAGGCVLAVVSYPKDKEVRAV